MALEVISADSPQVSLNDPAPGFTTITLNSITYNPGTNEMFIFHNGLALTIGSNYTEPNGTQIIVNFLPDAIAPDIDEFRIQTFVQGSSAYVPSPTAFRQLDASKRPNNFGGQFVFDDS
jgi:hypothetical protein